MSSIAKTSISLSKKDLANSKNTLRASRNIVFYHKATLGQTVIDLNNLTMPSSEMPSNVQATAEEISGANLTTFKKNLKLISTANGELHQGLDYVVSGGYTITLIGDAYASGAEASEIFIGTVNSSPMSDLTAVTTTDIIKSYNVAIGQTTVNLAQEYQVGINPLDNIGAIRVWINGSIALRDVDYSEVQSGTTGYGTTIELLNTPATAWTVVVDFGRRAITDINAMGAIESLSGAILKIATDLADVAGTTVTDYLTANPSEIERREYGDMVLDHESKLDISTTITAFTKVKYQNKTLLANKTTSGVATDMTFNNLVAGRTYRVSLTGYVDSTSNADPSGYILNTDGNAVAYFGHDQAITGTFVDYFAVTTRPFVAPINGSVTFSKNFATGTWYLGMVATLEELPNHEVTTQWT